MAAEFVGAVAAGAVVMVLVVVVVRVGIGYTVVAAAWWCPYHAGAAAHFAPLSLWPQARAAREKACEDCGSLKAIDGNESEHAEAPASWAAWCGVQLQLRTFCWLPPILWSCLATKVRVMLCCRF